MFWVYASNVARFAQSYRDVADRVDLAGRTDPQANIFKLMHDWMCSSKHKWLLILDNVDDARFLLEPHSSQGQTASKPLREYLPHYERGSILITTRNKEAALKLIEKRDTIAVEPMNKANAVALFEKKLGTQADNGEVVKLAAALEYMPLAIVQAAAFISNRSPRYSVAKYLGEYMKSERKKASLLNYDEGQLRRDWEAKNSIIVTWQISFEHIRQTRPSAANLLSLMSFFDRQGIPEHVLRTKGLQKDNNSRPGPESIDSDEQDVASQSSASAEESEDDEFEDDVLLLHNFSFVSYKTNGVSFEIHALVQLATQRWLIASGELERRKEQFISCLCATFPTNGEYENWTACDALFVHAKAAAALRPESNNSLNEWAKLLYRAAWYALKKGNAAEVEQLATKSTKAWSKVLGQEHENTLWSIAMLAQAYSLGGRYSDAEELEKHVLEISKRKLGEDHPDMLTIMHNLASTYLNQGRLDKAEELEKQVLELRKRKLGEDHPNTLTSMNNLALTYLNQGRLDKAEELGKHVLELRKRKLGEDHPDTLTSMNNLASTYSNQGRLDKAEELEKQVLGISKRKLGEDHPSTLNSMHNLALMYLNQGRPDKAEELGKHVLELRKRQLGEDHPDTLTSMNNLALTYLNQGRPDKAEELVKHVLEIRKTKLGDDHPDMLQSMNNLAITWKSQGRDADAMRLMSECIQLLRRVLGVAHPHYLTSLVTLTQWETEQAVNEDASDLKEADGDQWETDSDGAYDMEAATSNVGQVVN